MNKYNKYKKQYEKDQQTIKCFDKLYRKPSQDNIIDKREYKGLCIIFTNFVDESFLPNMKTKIKLNVFSHNKVKFQPRT